MIFSTFVYLIAAGMFVLLLPPIKYTRWTALGIFIFLGCLFAAFIEQGVYADIRQFTYPWIRYKDFQVDVDLSSSFYNYQFVLPVFMVILTAAFGNIFYPFEKQRLHLAAMMLFNLAAFILLIASQNTLQLLISSCIIGVVGFYVVNDFEARQKYIYFNLLADMGMFTVFAVLYGRLGTVELSELDKFGRDEAYLNFVPLLLLFSIFVKAGLFMFQNLLLDWHRLNFNRLMLASFCLTPITSIAILSKVNVIMQFSSYAVPLMLVFAAASMFWGFFGALSQNNIRTKALYLNMMVFGFFFGLLSADSGQVEDNYPFLLLVFYLINVTLSLVNLAASNETDISKMGGFIRSLKLTFIVTMIIIWADIQTVLMIARPSTQYWVWTFLALQLLALAQIYREIYFTRIRADERVWALLHNPNLLWLTVLATIAVLLIWDTYRGYVAPAWIFAMFLLAMFAAPFRNFSSFYENEAVQSNEWLNWIYENLLIAPIKIIGRILWLTVDFLLIERTVLSSISHFTGVLVAVSQKIQSYGWISYLLLGAGGVSIMVWWVMSGGMHG